MSKLTLNAAQLAVIKTAMGNQETLDVTVTNSHIGENTLNFSNGTSIVTKSLGLETGSVVTVDVDMNYIVKRRAKVASSQTGGCSMVMNLGNASQQTKR